MTSTGNNSMRDAVLPRLPQASIDLLDRIEQFAGLEVVFAGREALPDGFDSGGAPEACLANHEAATVFSLGAAPTPAGVTHELHHIERYWCEEVPQLFPRYDHPDNWRIVNAIENSLEHIVIIPRDVAIGFPNPERWNAGERRNWADYPWPDLCNPLVRRMKVFAGWLSCMEHINDDELRDLATYCITQEGLLEEATKFYDDLMGAIDDKPNLTALFLKALGLPREPFKLVTMDIRNRQQIVEPIPVV